MPTSFAISSCFLLVSTSRRAAVISCAVIPIIFFFISLQFSLCAYASNVRLDYRVRQRLQCALPYGDISPIVGSYPSRFHVFNQMRDPASATVWQYYRNSLCQRSLGSGVTPRGLRDWCIHFRNWHLRLYTLF